MAIIARRKESVPEALKEYQAKVATGEIDRHKALSPVEKSRQKPKSLRYAINAMCYDCSGYSRSEVKLCAVKNCPLHVLRPWQ